ncbi:MobH family relaxase [Burkholderia vietnamiensis]|uniref:MobH family relaxase n=1 Tax=Burkholderia vietnamiensis TaxID=60552 RepID=UPI001D138B0D|nr:MobH family relaxase [Burkholderia vietnamiensis]UEC01761.1 TraI domain-containing protein [Burkholderia vietnamiensis]
MVIGSPSGANAGRYASSDPGFETLPLTEILESHAHLLSRIKLCFGADRATFERELMPLVYGYARFVHLLPATANNYFHTPGGLLQLGLETAFFSLQGTDAHIFSGRATISERRELEPRWRIATFIGGLCCELHRPLSHLIITTAEGDEWPAFLIGLTDWLVQRQVSRYFVRWRPNARESRGLGLFALPHVIPASVLQSLGHGNAIILPQLMASVGGIPQYREHNVLDELVRRSMALVIDRNLLASADRYGTPQYGSHLERYLVDALRRLVAGHSAWMPNREKSRVWFGPDGLFLVWPGAAEDVLSMLESDQLAGIPKSPHTLLELLLDAEVFVAPDGMRQTWSILPPGAKAPLEAVKLSTPAIVLTGLDPIPASLSDKLLVPLSSTTPPPSPTPAPPSESASIATETPVVQGQSAPPHQQLSLLEGPSETEAPRTPANSSAPHSSTALHVAISLKAPMRLNPSVRSALAEVIATLNENAGASDVCTVAEGVFVPLSAFERRGIQPGIAIRALEEVKMLRRAAGNGPPTVSRQIRDESVVGLIVSPAYLEGLDQSLFTTSGTHPHTSAPGQPGRSA